LDGKSQRKCSPAIELALAMNGRAAESIAIAAAAW
jgi:hypothetical protein